MNRELLCEAIAIIEAIPTIKFDLMNIHAERPCGTVACAAGHLAMHPRFQALGLGLTLGGALSLDGMGVRYDHAMTHLFELSEGVAEQLFGPRRGMLGMDRSLNYQLFGTTAVPAAISDKELWLRRARWFLNFYPPNEGVWIMYSRNLDEGTVSLILVITAALIVVVLGIFIWPFHTVPTGSRGVVTQFGAIKQVEGEGLVILPPWQSLTLFSIRSEQEDVDKVQGSTIDTQPVDVTLTVRYAISPDKVASVFEQYSHTGDLSSYVQTAVQESFKVVTARYTAPDLIAKRAEVSAALMEVLGAKLGVYGAHVVNIDIRNFEFSESYMRAINDKVTQEQKRLAAENQLKTVEAEQQQKVAIADAEAQAKIKTAQADAKSIELQGEALRASANLLDLKRIEVERAKADKWNGVLPQNVYAGAPIPFLNVGR